MYKRILVHKCAILVSLLRVYSISVRLMNRMKFIANKL